jgi:CheY-like chemotaxis protein
MCLNLLLVDDDSKQRKIAKDAIELFLKKKPYEVEIDEAESLEQGVASIFKNEYDAAIIDLRLSQNDNQGEGNEILKLIKSKSRFPIRVVSGHLGDLEEQFKEKTYFSSYYSRDDISYDEIMEDFINIHQTGITNILNNKGRINEDISNIFWKHISVVLPEFVKHKQADSNSDIEKVLLRYISSHISEYLELSIENNLEPVLAIEFYIKPPIKSNIFTGDIIKKKSDSTFWMIMTPACDLATDAKRPKPKADHVTLCLIEKLDDVNNGRNSGDIKKLTSNNLDLKYHCLPQSFLFHGGYINFQKVDSIPIQSIGEQFDICLVVTGHFKKDIISRFSNYYSRQGQPSILSVSS